MPTNLVETAEFTDPIVIPEDGDDRTAASLLPLFRGFANRTRYLLNRAFSSVGFGVAGEIYYCNAATGAPETRVRTVRVPILGVANVPTAAGWWGPGTSATANDADLSLRVPLLLRTQTRLTQVRASVYQGGGGGGSPARMSVRRSVANGTDFNVDETIAAAAPSSTHAAASGGQILTLSGIAADVDPASLIEIVIISSGSAGDFADVCNWIEVTFSDPGPRNF